jgi:predicted  nucleic acid-binding Zn-ribbon protein
LLFKRRLTAAIEWRIDERVQGIRGDLRDTQAELEVVRLELQSTRQIAEAMRNELDRIIPHIAALETRIADGPGAESSTSTAREQDRMRVQLQAISHYEERLRRLESGMQQ